MITDNMIREAVKGPTVHRIRQGDTVEWERDGKVYSFFKVSKELGATWAQDSSGEGSLCLFFDGGETKPGPVARRMEEIERVQPAFRKAWRRFWHATYCYCQDGYGGASP